MKPQGQRPIRFPGKTDHHIRENGNLLENWWQSEGEFANKKADRQKAKRDINDDLLDFENEFNQYCDNQISLIPDRFKLIKRG